MTRIRFGHMEFEDYLHGTGAGFKLYPWLLLVKQKRLCLKDRIAEHKDIACSLH